MPEAKTEQKQEAKTFKQRLRAFFSDTPHDQDVRMQLSFGNMLILWFLAAFIGLILEAIFHVILFGSYESRAGLVLGPFSPVYGCGALLMTVLLDRIWYKNAAIIFIACAVIGGAFEWCTSFFMEYCFNSIAWDYTGSIGDIGGRTNLCFMLIWGIVGLFWVRVIFPPIAKFIHGIPANWKRVLVPCLTIFLVVDVVLTLAAFNREEQRKADIPASTPIARMCDRFFPSNWMDKRFHNTVFMAPGEDRPYLENPLP